VLKTVGFTDRRILLLVLSESLFLTLLGGGLGLLAAWAVVQQGDPTGGLLPIFSLPASNIAVGVVLMTLMGLVAGALPAVEAMRLRITNALRKT
jgi:putative ABC transport system permease protein